MPSELVLIIIGYIASLYIAWNIGANDAANPTDTAVGSGALSIRKALILFSVFTCIGALSQGWMVMKTFDRGIVKDIDIVAAVSAVIATGLWITIATLKGMPISTSQSATGAVLGIGLAYVYMGRITINDVKWSVVYTILTSWVLTPFLTIMLVIALYFVIDKLIYWLEKIREGDNSIEKILKYLIIFSLAFSAYSFGANDIANATGVYLTITSRYFGIPDDLTKIFLAILGGLGIALGGFTLGKRVLTTVAFKITRLDLKTGLAAELSNALVVWLFTTIPYLLFGYGLPISTTHATVSSIIGVGIAKHKNLKNVNWRIVLLITLSWLLTLPVTITLSFTFRTIAYMLTGS